MAKLNLNYYNNDSGYSDGGVETQILDLIKSGKTPEEIIETDERWPVYYHLTPKRENILNWYPFKKDASILEVGSGCGALTGLLCRKGDTVTSVELTLPRAQVNFERHKDNENLEIVVGNFNNMIFDREFDYIVLNGVLEYAGSFTEGKHPYRTFLERMHALLKEDGKILIAIENKLGLKYFNGTPEDHTAQLFSGLNNYQDIDFVKTFSKQELIHLLKDSGFKDFNFYYPVPDYKIPESIYTDETLSELETTITESVYNVNRLHLFDEARVMRSLEEEEIADRFQNSFLVEASPSDIRHEEKVIFAKAALNRKKDFAALTRIVEDQEGERRVIKSPLYPEAAAHLEKMYDYQKNFPGNNDLLNVPARRFDDEVVFEYLKGRTFESRLLELLNKDEREAFDREIKTFTQRLYEDSSLSKDFQTPEFMKMFGPEKLDKELHVIDNANIDLIYSNIIGDDQPMVIDYEWVTDFPVPVEFIVWRGLFYLYLKNDLAQYGIRLEDLMETAGIDPELSPVFEAWDNYFGNQYVGDFEDQRYYSEVVDVNSLLESLLRSQNQESTLYLDFGLGNFEDLSLREKYQRPDAKSDEFTITFDLKPFLEKEKGRIYNLRWDPMELPCRLEDVKITTNNGELELNTFGLDPEEGAINGDSVFFFSNDPNIDIVGDYEGVDTITITGKISPFSLTDTLDMASAVSLLKDREHKTVQRLKSEINEKEDRIRKLERKLKRLEEEKRRL